MLINIHCQNCNCKTPHKLYKPIEEEDLIQFICSICETNDSYLNSFEIKYKGELTKKITNQKNQNDGKSK